MGASVTMVGHQSIDLPAKDRFGLPLQYSLLCETDDQRDARVAAAEQLILDAFEAAVRHFGYKEARRRFRDVTKRPPKGKRSDNEVNQELLKIYDGEVLQGTVSQGEVPISLAEKIYESPKRLGASAEAIQKRLSRLLAAREKTKIEEEERAKMFQAALGMLVDF